MKAERVIKRNSRRAAGHPSERHLCRAQRRESRIGTPRCRDVQRDADATLGMARVRLAPPHSPSTRPSGHAPRQITKDAAHSHKRSRRPRLARRVQTARAQWPREGSARGRLCSWRVVCGRKKQHPVAPWREASAGTNTAARVCRGAGVRGGCVRPGLYARRARAPPPRALFAGRRYGRHFTLAIAAWLWAANKIRARPRVEGGSHPQAGPRRRRAGRASPLLPKLVFPRGSRCGHSYGME